MLSIAKTFFNQVNHNNNLWLSMIYNKFKKLVITCKRAVHSIIMVGILGWTRFPDEWRALMLMALRFNIYTSCFWSAKGPVPVHGLPQGPAGVEAVREDDDVVLWGGRGGAAPPALSLLLSFLLRRPLLSLLHPGLHVGFRSFSCVGINKTDQSQTIVTIQRYNFLQPCNLPRLLKLFLQDYGFMK